MKLSLRDAAPEDAERVWALSNDPVVRGVSFDSSPIPWETHIVWFGNAISDPGLRFSLAFDEEKNGEFAGQVRIRSKGGNEYDVSISVAPSYRGKGAGRSMLTLALDALGTRDPRALVHAWVKPDNLPSIKLFEGAGFAKVAGSPEEGDRLHFAVRLSDKPRRI